MQSEPGWHWRNCRDIGMSIHLFPLSWRFGFERNADVYGGNWRLSLGPVDIILHANIGNCSSENRFEAWLGLSQSEACDRALRFEVTASPSTEETSDV